MIDWTHAAALREAAEALGCGHSALRKRIRLRLDALDLDGGPGSGNWGHAGRPGMRGGSMPGGGAKNRMPAGDGTYTSGAKERKKLNRPSKYVKMHTYEDGEFSKIPMASKIRVRGSKGDFYNDGKGNLVCPKTGETISGSDLKGRTVAYRVPGYKVPAKTEEQALEEYLDGTRKPYESVTVLGKLPRAADSMADGMEVRVPDGRTLTAMHGQWMETGPGGLRLASYTGLPMTKDGAVEGVLTGNVYDLSLRRKGVNAETVRQVGEFMKDCPEALRDSYTRAFVTGNVFVDQRRGALYSSLDDAVHLSRESNAQTVLHEYAHLMDNSPDEKGLTCGGSSRKVQDMMPTARRQQDRVALADALGIEATKRGVMKGAKWKNEAAFMKYMRENIVTKVKPGNAPKVSDIISSATDNGLDEMSISGHPASYWKDLRPRGERLGIPRFCEPFAQFMVLKATGDNVALAEVKKILPNLYGALEQVYNESYGG